MKVNKDSWCRGPDCKYHPAKKLFKKRTITSYCLLCKRYITRNLYKKK